MPGEKVRFNAGISAVTVMVDGFTGLVIFCHEAKEPVVKGSVSVFSTGDVLYRRSRNTPGVR